MKKCPYCAEEIQDEAIICRFCSRDLISKPEVNEQKNRKVNHVVTAYLVFLIFAIFATVMASKQLNADLTTGLIYSSVYGLSALGLYMRQKWGYYLAFLATIPFFFSLFLIPLGLWVSSSLRKPDVRKEFGFINKKKAEKEFVNNKSNKQIFVNVIVILFFLSLFTFIYFSKQIFSNWGNNSVSPAEAKNPIVELVQPTITKSIPPPIKSPTIKPSVTSTESIESYRQKYISTYETKIEKCNAEVDEIERRVRSLNNDIFLSGSNGKSFEYYTRRNIRSILSICGSLGEMDPPDDYIDFNNFLVLAANEYLSYAERFSFGLFKEDLIYLEEAKDHYEKAIKYLADAKNIQANI